jgi:hypothetical protein
MSTTYGQKPIHDLPEWFPCANPLNANAAGGCVAYDQREGPTCHPMIYHFVSATVFNAYNPITDEWINLASPGMGTFAAGAGCVFVPSSGPSGTLSAGTSTTQFTIGTALPAAVVANQLANRGDGVGFYIRVCDVSGGVISESQIVANTAGTQPVITVSPALGFTPANTDKYEILSGRVLLMATAASICKYYDVATNSFSAALTVTNLTAPAIDNAMVVLDELYTPSGNLPSEGFFKKMTATATTNVTNATVTGTIGASDASLVTNEYANFQLRIVEDTTNPTAVNQRIKITSHTGANPTVYTCTGVFAVAPSNTAKYVIEGIGDVICFTGSSVALSHTYRMGGYRADGAWSTGVTAGVASLQIPARPANTGTGTTACWAYGLSALDPQKVARYSSVYLLRGGATATMDVLDIATLSWSTGTGVTDLGYGNKGLLTFTTGSCSAYDPNSNDGRYWYINQSGTQRFFRFDTKNRVMLPWCYYRQPQGTATIGERMATAWAVDGTTHGAYIYVWGATQSTWFRILVTGY